MTDWRTFGHDLTKRILEKQIKAQKFPHAYLFVGPEGIGKRHLVLEFAQKILNTENLANHPDFLELNLEGEIPVEETRNFIAKLSLKPFFGQYKIAILNNAHNLNTQSSNALLKTLEEPSESTVIILVANKFNLLPTIVSRCQVLNFRKLGLDELQEFAKQNHIKTTKETLALSFGSVSKFIKYSENTENLKELKNRLETLQNLKGKQVGYKLLAIKDFAEFEDLELEQLLETWLGWEQERLNKTLTHAPVLKFILEALGELKTNKNRKLILESLFLKI